MDPVERLRTDYRAREDAAMVRLGARRRRDARNGAVAGAFAGLVAVFVTAAVTRTAWMWHSCVLEAVLGAVAGLVLARRGGGVLTGILLFSASYFAAWLARACGLDPSVLFEAGDVRASAAVTGHVTALSHLVAAGGLMGHVIHDG
jgi:hypothetical protein